jgi:dihydroneopterin aldolase
MVKTLVFPNARRVPKVNKTWTLLINDVVFQTYIGINPEEALARQTVRLNLRCQVSMPVPDDKNYHGQFVCYDQLIKSITSLAQSRHIHLVETLAEEIATLCLADKRMNHVWCRVEKLDVYSNATSVGVEIERERNE